MSKAKKKQMGVDKKVRQKERNKSIYNHGMTSFKRLLLLNPSFSILSELKVGLFHAKTE